MTMQASQISLLPISCVGQADSKATKNLEVLLSSLPKENGWNIKLFNYQGHWIPAYHLQGIVPFQNNFQAQDSDILLVALPKCGTTWLKAIVFAISNRVQYGSVASPQHPLLIRSPHDLIPQIDLGIYGQNKNPDLSCFQNPRLFATHLPYESLPQSVKDSACKIVYVSRNPKDTFISLLHFTNKLIGHDQDMEQAFDLFCEGRSSYGPYWDHVLEYHKKSLEMPEKMIFLKYEDMKKEPVLYMKKLAEFLGCPFSAEEEASGVIDEIVRLCSFENLSHLDVNKNGKLLSVPWAESNVFFRRGVVGDSKNFLSEEMVKRMDGITEEKFKAYGLEL